MLIGKIFFAAFFLVLTHGVGAVGLVFAQDSSLESSDDSKGASHLDGSPTDEEYAERVLQSGTELTLSQWNDVWQKWRTAQAPSRTKEGLLRIAMEKHSRIEQLQVKFHFARSAGRGRDDVLDQTKWKVVIASERHMQAWSPKDAAGWESVVSYDGKLRRSLNAANHLDYPVGRVEEEGPLLRPVPGWGPLGSAMLGDVGGEPGSANKGESLISLLKDKGAYVLENSERVDGKRCVVVALLAPPASKFYLDPSRGMAVLKVEHYKREWSPAAWRDGRWRSLTQVRRNKRLIEVEEGIWLPKLIERTRYNKGKIIGVTKVVSSQMNINDKVDSGVFENIFPRGALIIDEVIGMTYRSQVSSSIDSMVEEAIRVSRATGINLQPVESQNHGVGDNDTEEITSEQGDTNVDRSFLSPIDSRSKWLLVLVLGVVACGVMFGIKRYVIKAHSE